MPSAASNAAAKLVKHIHILSNKHAKYQEQNVQLQLYCEYLQEEIANMRRAIERQDIEEARLLEQLAYKDIGKSKLKRQRSELEDLPHMRHQRLRLETQDDRLVQLQTGSESDLSLNSKRKGRVFYFGKVSTLDGDSSSSRGD